MGAGRKAAMSSTDWLLQVAQHLGKADALSAFYEAQATEDSGDFAEAARLYKRAYRLWPALDSRMDDEIPTAVKEEALLAGLDLAGLAAPEMDTGPSPRFELADRQAWLEDLDEHGYVVIQSVADVEAVAKAKSLLWDFLENCRPDAHVRRDNPATWEKGCGWVPSVGNGLIGGHGIGQSRFSWHMRLLPGVKEAFAAVWGEEDLLVSFDGGNVFRPWKGKPEWKTDGGWWHIDQNCYLTGKEGRVSVQGMVTFTDATPETGGLCVVPHSHKDFRGVCERAYAQKLPADFVPVQSSDPALSSGTRLVCAKAGDLLLCDSRCVHCNTPGTIEDVDMSASIGCTTELLRAVGYVFMTPSALASVETIVQRKDAFVNNVTTSHWPHEICGYGPPPPTMLPQSWVDASDDVKALVVGTTRVKAY